MVATLDIVTVAQEFRRHYNDYLGKPFSGEPASYLEERLR
jgi:hypothetical protein